MIEQATVIGIDPEGTRSLLDDPCKQLAAKPGPGKLIALCDPDVVVVPCFVLGASNDVHRLARRNFRR
ncbi:MAG TPA: hypothetical protein DCQ06_08285 [Myxococcales bacterium]|nr:hypothetical protein [Myxococcales bacterium]HAN31582.1 hypothetical protein [Myxococcales bacterium]